MSRPLGTYTHIKGHNFTGGNEIICAIPALEQPLLHQDCDTQVSKIDRPTDASSDSDDEGCVYYLPSDLFHDDEGFDRFILNAPMPGEYPTSTGAYGPVYDGAHVFCSEECVKQQFIFVRKAFDPKSHAKAFFGQRNISPATSSNSMSSFSGSASAGVRYLKINFFAANTTGVPLMGLTYGETSSAVLKSEDRVFDYAGLGVRGQPYAIQVIFNENGLAKRNCRLPIRCYCSSITRSQLAKSLANAMNYYLRTETRRRGFERVAVRRGVQNLYLYSVRSNDKGYTWRIKFHEGTTIKSKPIQPEDLESRKSFYRDEPMLII